MATLLAAPYNQFLDDDGNPLTGGFVYTYEAGTDTPKATYTDYTGDNEAANPIELDAAGMADIWIDGFYKMTVTTADDVIIRTVDYISSSGTAVGAQTFYDFNAFDENIKQLTIENGPDPDFPDSGTLPDVIHGYVALGAHTCEDTAADASAIVMAKSDDSDNCSLRLTGQGEFGQVHSIQNGFTQFNVGGGVRTSDTEIGLINYLDARGITQGAGNNPSISAQRASASQSNNFGITFYTIGIGSHYFMSANATVTQFEISHTASGVNYLKLAPSIAGSPITFTATGTDSNISFRYLAKGDASHQFYINSGIAVQISGSSSAIANYLQLGATATGSDPYIAVQGSDATRGLTLYTSGTGNFNFYSDNLGVRILKLTRVASGVNYAEISPGATGNGVIYGVNGSDSNVDHICGVRGTGVVKKIMGASTGYAKLTGVISNQTTPVGNVGGGTDDLMTYSLPANSLSQTGQSIRIRAWGLSANNANGKTLTINFGSEVLMSVALTANQVNAWCFDVSVLKIGASSQTGVVTFIQGGTVVQTLCNIFQPAITDTSAITIKCTGAATTNNDIEQTGMTVEFIG